MACVAGCNAVHTSCVAGFNSAAVTYGGGSSPNPSNIAMCDSDWNSCVARCGSGSYGYGGTGGGGGVGLTDEQRAVLRRCEQMLLAADADSDSQIAHDEYLRQIELRASDLCPGSPRPESYNDEFQGLSCILCVGLADPYDPHAHDGYCPCVDGVTPAGPISLDAAKTTAIEGLFYCEMVHEAAAVSCVQPDRECYDECFAVEMECHGDCSAQGTLYDCIDGCNVPFYACLEECVAPQDSSLANGAGGAGGGAVVGAGGGAERGVGSLSSTSSRVGSRSRPVLLAALVVAVALVSF